MAPSAQPSMLLSLLMLAFLWPSGSVAQTRATFTQEATCPAGDLLPATSAGLIRQVSGAQDRRTCLVECATWQQCVAVHVSATAGSCQLASLTAWLSHWQNGTAADCVSYVRPPPLPDSIRPKLLAFYNFRFGLANQVNASAFPVTLSNAKRSRAGLNLIGDFSSYAEIDLMGRGISGHLDAGLNGAFFIKVSTTFDYEDRCFHGQYNRTMGSADGTSGHWCKANFDGSVAFLARDLLAKTFQSSGPLLPIDTVNQWTYSTAVTFGQAHAGSLDVQFFYNATADTATPTVTDTAGPTGDDGLRVGYNNAFPFKGLVHCYGIAKAELTVEDLQQLDGQC